MSSKRTPAFDVPDVRQASGFQEVVEVFDLERWSIIQRSFEFEGESNKSSVLGRVRLA